VAYKKKLADIALNAAKAAGASYADARIGRYLNQFVTTRETRVDNIVNTVSADGEESDLVLAVQSTFGKGIGVATINEFDVASLEKVVRRSEELAKLAPENSEHMPVFGPQKYAPSKTYFESTANIHRGFYHATHTWHSYK